jgi:hypothetical protein
MRRRPSASSAGPRLGRIKKAAAPAKIQEWAGDLIGTCYWIKIGLNRDVVRALTDLGKRWGISKSPCSEMARYLISLSVLNLGETEAKLLALTRYMEAEGFNSLGSYCWDAMRILAQRAK